MTVEQARDLLKSRAQVEFDDSLQVCFIVYFFEILKF